MIRTTALALHSGTLRPIATEFDFVDDVGVRFLVRVASNLDRKDRIAPRQRSGGARAANPFLPYEQELFVADATSTHVCLLNKFNVVEHHLLIVTREFEDQLTLLGLADFEALWRCLAEYESLGFYNAGTVAGASQAHKHLQTVPLPLAPHGLRVPLEPLLLRCAAGRVAESPALPFNHRVRRFANAPGPRVLRDTYHEMLEQLDLLPAETGPRTRPYNLLVTREWMLLVPRRREHAGAVSVNALGYAGAMLVRGEDQLRWLRARGPMQVLRDLSSR